MEVFRIPHASAEIGAVRPARRRRGADEMLVDEQTLRDLEIFEAQGGAPGLFDLLDRTRTVGGAKVLQARMRQPWAKPERIRAVQQSLRHILDHRPAFNLLPGEGVVAAAEQYLYSGLPFVETENPFVLFVDALEVRFGHFKQYWRILTGVQRTAQMIHALRRLAARPELADAPGELGPWLDELRGLVDRPAFATLPEEGEGPSPCWRIMRVDRMLRRDERETIERLIRLIFEVDALVSMADAVHACGFVIPEVHDGPTEVVAQGVYHPFVTRPVPNPLRLDQRRRMLFLTGPNMAGKTTYLRACGVAVYLAHVGMGVPARSFRFSPCDCLISAIALADNVRGGVSFFQAEALRFKTIAEALAAGRRVVALLDEPFMGTNVKDALDASRAVLARLAATEGSVFLVSSHLIELGDALIATGSVDCRRFEAGDRAGRLEFDYVLRPGVSSQRLGVRVLEEHGIFDLLDRTAPPVPAGGAAAEG